MDQTTENGLSLSKCCFNLLILPHISLMPHHQPLMIEVKAWNLEDDQVMATICMTIDLSIRSCLEDHNTAKEMWDYLKGCYQQSSSALRYSLRQNLHHLQQQDMSVEEYYSAFTKISRQLDSMVPKPSPLCKDCVPSWTDRDKYDQRILCLTL